MRTIQPRCRRRNEDRRVAYALAVAVLAGLLLIGFGATNLIGPTHSGWSVVGLGAVVVAVGTLLLVVDPPLARPLTRPLKKQ